MISRIAAGVILSACATVALAQADAAAARNKLMKDMGGQLYGVINRINRGDQSYDQAKVDAALVGIEEMLSKAKSAFDTKTTEPAANSRYHSSAKIWENKADFNSGFDKTLKVVADYKGKIKSADELKAAYTTINNSCNSCHETYQVKN